MVITRRQSVAKSQRDEEESLQLATVKKLFFQYMEDSDFEYFLKAGKIQDREQKIVYLKKIYEAHKADISKLLTLTVLSFQNPLTSCVQNVVKVKIELLAFENHNLLETRTVFESHIYSNLKSRPVSYFPSVDIKISRDLFKQSTKIFFVARAFDVQSGEYSDHLTRGKQTKTNSTSTFVGVRCISDLQTSPTKTIQLGTRSIQMFDECDQKISHLVGQIPNLDSLMRFAEIAKRCEVAGHKATLRFELVNDCGKFNWNHVIQKFEENERLRRVEDENTNRLRFVWRFQDPELDDVPSKKFKIEQNSLSLLEMPAIRCPFTLRDFGNTNELVGHLNALNMGLSFYYQAEDCVEVSVFQPRDEEEMIIFEPTIVEIETEKKAELDHIETLCAQRLVKPHTFSSNFCHMLVTTGFYEDYCGRKLMQMTEYSLEEKMLMKMFNKFMSSFHDYTVSSIMKRKRVMDFFTSSKDEIKENCGFLLILHFLQKLHENNIVTSSDMLQISSSIL